MINCKPWRISTWKQKSNFDTWLFEFKKINSNENKEREADDPATFFSLDPVIEMWPLLVYFIGIIFENLWIFAELASLSESL